MAASGSRLRVPAPAKINLFLHVGDKRADGYHALQSLVAFVEERDVVAFEPADALTLHIDGPFAQSLKHETDNLVLKAARLFAERNGIERGAAIHLTKNLPVASGMGGGSADAAATLRGLASLWAVTTPPADFAATIGSDVPVCLLSRAAWMEGRGERVLPLPDLPPVAIVLANPGIAVPTAPVFSRLADRSGAVAAGLPPQIASVDELVRYLQSTRNDLEIPARSLAPPIGETLAILRAQGALLERMSGSGATCFGLFESEGTANEAARRISDAFPAWWVRATRLARSDIGTPRNAGQ